MPRLTVFLVSVITAAGALRLQAKAAVSYYADSRSFNTITVQTSAPDLPWRFSMWGFVDLHGSQRGTRLDATRNFVECRLIRALWRGLELHAEYNDASGKGNNLLRYGIGIAPRFQVRGRPGWALARFSPYETDGSGQQMTFAWSVPLAPRVSINGFADWNLERNGNDRWVFEPELAIAATDRFAFVLEPRYNGFEAQHPNMDGFGVALGGTVKF